MVDQYSAQLQDRETHIFQSILGQQLLQQGGVLLKSLLDFHFNAFLIEFEKIRKWS